MFNFNQLNVDNKTIRASNVLINFSKDFATKYIYAALAGIAFTTPSFAQNITAEAGLSTLGLYAAPIYEMNENIDVLVPRYFGSQNYK